MALSDIYYQQPWNPMASANQSVASGLQTMADEPRRKMELERGRLENERMRQDLPDNPATPHGTNMGNHVRAMLENTPGHRPGFADRLIAEAQQGGMGAPQGAPQQGPGLGAPGPVGPPVMGGHFGMGGGQQPMGFPNAQQPPSGQGFAPNLPQPDSVERNFIAGQGPQYASDMTGMQRPQMQGQAPQVPAPQVAQAQPPQGAPPQDLGPQTNRDVNMYMHMAPFLKQQKDDQRLAIAREQMAARQKLADQNDKLRRDLARLSAAYRQSPDDKLLIAKMHEAAANLRASMGDITKMESGLRGVIDDPGVEAQIEAERKANHAAQDDYESALEEAKPRGRGTKTSASASGTKSSTVRVKGPKGEVQEGPASNVDAFLKDNPGWSVVPGGK